MKSMKGVAKDLKDDLKFAEKIERSWKRYEEGKFKKMKKEEFLKEIEKW